ncbi:MAG: type II toxin-antitoxin system VapC family toxin [Pseudomonadota bacterium]
MKILLDTNVLLWALASPDRLQPGVRHDLENAENTILFSAASIWEIAIKSGLGRPDFAYEPIEILKAAEASNFEEILITSRIAARVKGMTLNHSDPFDRLILAQAEAAESWLYTSDKKLWDVSPIVKPIGRAGRSDPSLPGSPAE